MKGILIWLFLLLAFSPVFASAATINAASCSYADVQTAISSAASGDTVLVPAGSCTWNNNLVITKGIYLIGAGIGKTFITSGYDAPVQNRAWSSSYLILYEPASSALNEPFRVSGFSFDGDDRCGFIYLHNPTITPVNKIRIDHNNITKTWVEAIFIYGTLYGVADNNVFSGTSRLYVFVSPYGLNEKSWNSLTFDFGSANNFYFEDNEFTSSNGFFDGGVAGRVCIRYNNFIYTGGNDETVVDAHGNQPGANHAAMGVEVYENMLDFGSASIPLIGQRGGKGLLYNNYVTTTGSYVAINIAEEYNDNINPPASSPISGQPQHVSDSYYWNNLKNGAPVTDVNIVYTVDYGGEIGIVPQANRDFWYEGAAAFDGTIGVGHGILSVRPSTCTIGVGYWANDTKTLYKCNATDTWIAYYTPYTYPHPFRTDCVNYPELCDSDAATINAASCSYSDVQAAINVAQDGDTVQIPEGNCTWNSTLTFSKGIVLQGSGTDKTFIRDGTPNSYWNAVVEVTGSEGKPFRITGISFVDVNDAGIMIYGTAKNWRIDHCNILTPATQWGGVGINVYPNGPGYSYGLIDHCYIRNMNAASVQMFSDNDAAWNRPLTLGTSNAIYMEDCMFDSRLGLSSGTDGAAGLRFVLRHSTLTNSLFHLHGTDSGSARGTHSYEYYSNKLIADGTVNCYGAASIRGGTGVVFNNAFIGNWGDMRVDHACACTTDPNDNRCGGRKLCTGYPCLDQIGRTTDSNRDGIEDIVPLYAWNNTDDGAAKNLMVASTCPAVYTYVQEGRDFYNNNVTYNSSTGMYEAQYKDDDNSTKQWSYKPYIYPHPLTLAAFGTDICDEGQITFQCWCQGMKSSGYCCNGYYKTTSCDDGGAQPVPGDLDGDGVVDINDLSFIAGHFGQSNAHPQWNVTADVVVNSEIDIFDIVFVASRFT